MDISIVGSGHTVTIANSRGPASLAQLADETGATAAETADAIARARVLIVSVPTGALPGLGRNTTKSASNLPKALARISEVATVSEL